MKDKSVSTKLCNTDDKIVSGWEIAILEAKRKIRALRVAIRTFEEAQAAGLKFPDSTSKSANKHG
jgi:hypothetical protein